jgi:hypothetical protein
LTAGDLDLLLKHSQGDGLAAQKRPADFVGLRAALLVGVSLSALSIAFGGMSAEAADLTAPPATKIRVVKAPPLPPPPSWFFSAEGGAACSTSNIAVRSPFVPGANLAHVGNACGWTTRVGFTYRRPVLGMIELTADGSAAALWGRFKTNVDDTLIETNAYSISGQDSHNGWVGNLEGSIALAYAPYGPRGWDVSLGVRAEDWFSQIDGNAFNASSFRSATGAPAGLFSISGQHDDRFNWGPFLRVKVPFGN